MTSFISIVILTVFLFEILISNVSATIFRFGVGNNTNSSITFFNNLYLANIEEKYLSFNKKCKGDCTEVFSKKFKPNYRKINENCFGKIHACLPIFDGMKLPCQLCACLCERKYDPNFQTNRGKLINSFCLDSVSVDFGHVATGVRFREHENRIHVEFQQGKFINGKVIKETVSWKSTEICEKSKMVIKNFNAWNYSSMKIKLEDFILPTKAAVTGITFPDSLQGKYFDFTKNNGNATSTIHQLSQCDESASNIDDLVGDSWNFSVPCKHYVSFKGSAYEEDFAQHVLPFIDLREIVTSPPRPIRGIGWYLQRDPDFTKILSLRIF